MTKSQSHRSTAAGRRPGRSKPSKLAKPAKPAKPGRSPRPLRGKAAGGKAAGGKAAGGKAAGSRAAGSRAATIDTPRAGAAKIDASRADTSAGADAAADLAANLIDIQVDALAAGGEGVGRDASGRVTFVPYSAPGDRIRARMVSERRDYARAEPVALLASSNARVAPPCALFAQRACGGCQWQHVAAQAQVAAKQDIVAHALRRHVAAGMTLRPLAPLGAATPPYHWRRRARLHWFRPRKAPAAVIGFFAPRSHRVVDIAGCAQLEPALHRAYEAIRAHLAPMLGREGEIALLAGHDGAVHAVIRGRCTPASARALVGQAGIAGVVLQKSEAGPQGKGRHGKELSWGAPTIELEPGLAARADWFAQPSAAGNRALLAAVDRAAGPRQGLRIIELYAGTGNLTRVLGEGAAELVAVERKAPPWPLPADLAGRFRWGDVAEVTRDLAQAGERFDLAVLDPPRTGAREALAALVALAPARIVYVSCDPATLARDMSELAAAGYRAVSAQPLDPMPQTAHVEVVVEMTREG